MPFGIPENSPLGQLAEHLFNRQQQKPQTPAPQQPASSPVSSGSSVGSSSSSDHSYVSATGQVINPDSVNTSQFSSPATQASNTSTSSNQGTNFSSTSSSTSTSQPQQSPHEQEMASLLQEANTAWALYDFGTVIRDLKALDALDPGNPETKRLLGVSYFNLARQQEDKGDFNGARQNYEEALKIEPENAEYRGWSNQLNNKNKDRK